MEGWKIGGFLKGEELARIGSITNGAILTFIGSSDSLGPS